MAHPEARVRPHPTWKMLREGVRDALEASSTREPQVLGPSVGSVALVRSLAHWSSGEGGWAHLTHSALLVRKHAIRPPWTKMVVVGPVDAEEETQKVKEIHLRIGHGGGSISGKETLLPLLRPDEVQIVPHLGIAWQARHRMSGPIDPDEAMQVMYEQLRTGAGDILDLGAYLESSAPPAEAPQAPGQ